MAGELTNPSYELNVLTFELSKSLQEYRDLIRYQAALGTDLKKAQKVSVYVDQLREHNLDIIQELLKIKRKLVNPAEVEADAVLAKAKFEEFIKFNTEKNKFEYELPAFLELVGYEIAGVFTEQQNQNNPNQVKIKKDVNRYFGLFHMAYEIGKESPIKAQTYLTEVNKELAKIINPAADAYNDQKKACLANVYLFLFKQLQNLRSESYFGSRKIISQLETAIRKFERDIAEEAQDTTSSFHTEAKELFGFIMMRKVLDLSKQGGVIYRTFNPASHYHDDFLKYYTECFSEKQDAMTAIQALFPAGQSEVLNINKEVLKESIEKIKAVNKRLHKIHDALEIVNPKVFKEHYLLDKKEAQLIEKMEDYVFNIAKSRKYNVARRKEGLKFFNEYNPFQEQPAQEEELVQPQPAAQAAKILLPNTQRAEKISTNLQQIIKELKTEDDGRLLRYGSGSKLNTIAQSGVANFNSFHNASQSIKEVYQAVQVLNREWVNALTRIWRVIKATIISNPTPVVAPQQ